MNKIYLVRHGENLANITKQFSCRKVDYPLTPKGILQARQTAEYFHHRRVDEVYSSPLKRARETAEIIAAEKGLRVKVMENFREVNVGEMEDWPPTEENWIKYFEVVADWYNGNLERRFPGGEHQLDLRKRMSGGIERIVKGKDGESIVVVGHGGIFASTILDLCPGTDATILENDYGNCAISEIDVSLSDGRVAGRLRGWGFCSHLTGDAATQVRAVPDSVTWDALSLEPR